MWRRRNDDDEELALAEPGENGALTAAAPLVWALLTASESNMRASSPANFGRTAACSTKTQHPGLLKDDTAALRVEACASDQDFKKKRIPQDPCKPSRWYLWKFW